MVKKVISVMMLCILQLLFMVGFAKAHHPVLIGSTTCSTENTYEVEWLITADAIRGYTWSIDGGATRIADNLPFTRTTTETAATASLTISATWYSNGELVFGPALRTGTVTRPPECERKVLICHRDQGKPGWVEIEIAISALPAHLAHQWGEDIYPVPEGGCPVDTTTTTTTTLPPTTTSTSTTTTVVDDTTGTTTTIVDTDIPPTLPPTTVPTAPSTTVPGLPVTGAPATLMIGIAMLLALCGWVLVRVVRR